MSNNNEFIQAMLETVDGKISGIHTAAPGKIINYSSGLASVQPSIRYKVEDGRVLDAPVIVNVPVYFPTGGAASITYPIKPGDDCCIVFAERSIDDWLKGGESEDPRKFDLTDAMCFVGMKPSRNHSNEAIEITHGSCMLRIPDGGPVSLNTDIVISGISFLGHVHPESIGSQTSPPK